MQCSDIKGTVGEEEGGLAKYHQSNHILSSVCVCLYLSPRSLLLDFIESLQYIGVGTPTVG